MATIRQLTTRFNFETDTRGVQNFRNTLGGMKKTVLGVAAALGAGVAGKAVVQLGTGLESAAVAAGRFNDEIKLTDGSVRLTGEMADAWDRVQENIPGRVNMAPFLRSFIQFRQLLKDRPIDEFNTLFETAGRLAVITGDNVESTFERLTKAATSGDFQPLQEIFPNFDTLDKSMQGFIQRLLEVDPTNVNNVKISLDRFLRVVRAGAPELGKFSTQVFDDTTKAQFGEFGRNLKEIGSLMGLHLSKPMRGALKDVNEYLNTWLDAKKTLPDIFSEIGKDMRDALDASELFGPLLRLVERFTTEKPTQETITVEPDPGRPLSAREQFQKDFARRTPREQFQEGAALPMGLTAREQSQGVLSDAAESRVKAQEFRRSGVGRILERIMGSLLGSDEERAAKVAETLAQAKARRMAREQQETRRRGVISPGGERELFLEEIHTPAQIKSREGLAGPREPAPPGTASVIQNATFHVAINGAQDPRAIVEEFRNIVGRASLSFPPVEAPT